jgi:hypothetical protein
MAAETTPSAHSPATSPLWTQYYQRARELRRLGRGQNALFKLEIKRRRRRSTVILLASTAALVVVIALFCVLLNPSRGEPEGHAVATPARTA